MPSVRETPTFARVVYGIRGPKAKVLGCEFAGTVVDTGESVTAFAVGDRVFGYVEGRFGGHAELLVVAEHASVARNPANLTFEEAAAGTEGSHYALGMIRAARVQTRRHRAGQRSDGRDRVRRGAAVARDGCGRDGGLLR